MTPAELVERVNTFIQREGWAVLVASDKNPKRLVKRKALTRRDIAKKWLNATFQIAPEPDQVRNVTEMSLHCARMGLINVINPRASKTELEPTFFGAKSDWLGEDWEIHDHPTVIGHMAKLKRFLKKGLRSDLVVCSELNPGRGRPVRYHHYTEAARAWNEEGRRFTQYLRGSIYFEIGE